MLKNHFLLKTYIKICMIFIIGITAGVLLTGNSYRDLSATNIESQTLLAANEVYYKVNTMIKEPLNVSGTMAENSLLKKMLSEEPEEENKEYSEVIKEYLNSYKKGEDYTEVSFISANSKRYYTTEKEETSVISEDDHNNAWYFTQIEGREEYTVTAEWNQEAELIVYANYKVKDKSNKVLGIVRVGRKMNEIQNQLQVYDETYGTNSYLIDDNGIIEVSSDYTRADNCSFFDTCGLVNATEIFVSLVEGNKTKKIWLDKMNSTEEKSYTVIRGIRNFPWKVISIYDNKELLASAEKQNWKKLLCVAVISLVSCTIIIFGTHSFSHKTTQVLEEKTDLFRRVTEQIYEDIYEINITKNCAAGKSAEKYFEKFGIPEDSSYDMALNTIAETRISPEFRQKYIATFSPRNVLQEYRLGNTHLQYDFKIMKEDKAGYFWERMDAYISYSKENSAVYMFIYMRDIDSEKWKNKQMRHQAQADAMTQLYNKTSTQNYIAAALLRNRNAMHAFYIFDIDNFKQANDKHGHAFGDSVIITFSEIIKRNFREEDIIGRIGGDEFVAFATSNDIKWIEERAQTISKELDRIHTNGTESWKMSASIGIAIAPNAGTDFNTLYRHADAALYQTKLNGKNGYAIYQVSKK